MHSRRELGPCTERRTLLCLLLVKRCKHLVTIIVCLLGITLTSKATAVATSLLNAGVLPHNHLRLDILIINNSRNLTDSCTRNDAGVHIHLTPSTLFTNLVRYLTALYWMMATSTSTGYGDLHPRSESTRLFAIVVMLVGQCGFGIASATIAATLANLATTRLNAQSHLNAVAR